MMASYKDGDYLGDYLLVVTVLHRQGDYSRPANFCVYISTYSQKTYKCEINVKKRCNWRPVAKVRVTVTRRFDGSYLLLNNNKNYAYLFYEH